MKKLMLSLAACAASVCGLAASSSEGWTGREITVPVQPDGARNVRATFGEATSDLQLWMAWGLTDGGEDVASWENTAYVGILKKGESEKTVKFPDCARYVRLFTRPAYDKTLTGLVGGATATNVKEGPYIDTGYTPHLGQDRMVASFTTPATKPSGTEAVFAARKVYNSGARFGVLVTADPKIRFDYTSSGTTSQHAVSASNGQRYDVEIDGTTGQLTVTPEGGEASSKTTTRVDSPAVTQMRILGTLSDNTVPDSLSRATLHSLAVWKGSELVRNYIPVQANGVNTLYETVLGELMTPSKAGSNPGDFGAEGAESPAELSEALSWSARCKGPVVEPLVNPDDPTDVWGRKISGIGDGEDEVSLVFTKAGAELNWTIPEGVTEIRYLVVGGGGGGGFSYGGGGGGGGFKEDTLSVSGGEAVAIAVGAGGEGAATSVDGGTAMNGSPSSLKVGTALVAEAAGGGLGGSWSMAGGNGACGGGAGMGSKGAIMSGGTGSEGGNGASGAVEIGGGGGGVSGNASGIAAGAGKTSDITGESLGYAGGGGAGVKSTKGQGGLGKDGGGNGGGMFGGTYTPAQPGVNGGGGGGGGVLDGGADDKKIGAKGGDGVVAIRYVDPTAKPLNEFVAPPSVEPAAWCADEVPETVTINLGQTMSGDAATCSHTVAEILAFAPGRHAITFTAPETDQYKEHTETVYVTVGYPAAVGAVEIKFPGYAGTETLRNFPVLVRVSAERIDGLETTKFSLDGADVRFFAEDGTELAHEVELWNPAGESLVWVKVPALTSATAITMSWGKTAPRTTADADVWSDYAVVHHFSDATESVCADSSGNGFQATLPSAGVIGPAKFGNGASTEGGDGVAIGSYAALGLGGSFAASGWFYAQNVATQSKWVMFFGNKEDYNKGNGFMLRMQNGYQGFLYAGNGTQQAQNGSFSSTILGRWIYLTVTCDDGMMRIYENGGLKKDVAYTVSDSTLPLTVGKSLTGLTDEIRVRKGAVSADWAATEYKAQSDDSFSVCELVQNPELDSILVTLSATSQPAVDANLNLTIPYVVVSTAGQPVDVKALYAETGATVTNEAVIGTAVEKIGMELSGTVADLKPATEYAFAIFASDADGNVSPTSSWQSLATPGPCTDLAAACAYDATGVTVSGSVTPGVGTTTVSVCYRLNDAADWTVRPVELADNAFTAHIDVGAGEKLVWYAKAENSYTSPTHGDFTWPVTTPEKEVTGLATAVGMATITFPGYTGTETLTNFPVLVRISDALIDGLQVKKLSEDGKDVRFFAADGTELAHEIDTWNPAGESLVWVKVPELTSATTVTMFWGRTEKRQTADADVWTGYDGVWHFNEQAGTTFADATEGGLAASVGEGVMSEISDQVVGTGVTLTNAPENKACNLLCTGAKKISGQMTFSGWYQLKQTIQNGDTSATLIRCGGWDKGGFYLEAAKNDADGMTLVVGSGLANFGNGTTAQLKGNMHHVAITVKPGATKAYLDGNSAVNQTWSLKMDWNDVLALVSNVRSASADEIRLRPTAVSADWAKAEYLSQKKGSTFAECRLVKNPKNLYGLMVIIK